MQLKTTTTAAKQQQQHHHHHEQQWQQFSSSSSIKTTITITTTTTTTTTTATTTTTITAAAAAATNHLLYLTTSYFMNNIMVNFKHIFWHTLYVLLSIMWVIWGRYFFGLYDFTTAAAAAVIAGWGGIVGAFQESNGDGKIHYATCTVQSFTYMYIPVLIGTCMGFVYVETKSKTQF